MIRYPVRDKMVKRPEHSKDKNACSGAPSRCESCSEKCSGFIHTKEEDSDVQKRQS
jgi:hypothetical protein